MNLKLQSSGVSGGGRRREDAIALVITLLMLSVITFLAVALLAMTRRDRAAVAASVDANGARSMSEAALARAQAEIMARMMAQTDWLSYDYMVSQDYINPYGFNVKSIDTTNVNYDYRQGVPPPGNGMSPALNSGSYWAQNIADLFYDPRPPVFVVTNAAYPTNSDFRFWVDVNRNGRFETNGYIPTVTNEFGALGPSQVWNGEPEWIGVLSDPLYRHSSSNRFIGRYAYMVLPIGKTLDLNYIHNWDKGYYVNTISHLTNDVGPLGLLAGSGLPSNPESDGFARDQGVGSWELNLAATLDVLNPWIYENNPYYLPNPYNYVSPSSSPGGENTGYAFDDAEGILHYRYYIPPGSLPATWVPTTSPSYILASLNQLNYTNLVTMDSYCMTAPTNPPFDYNPVAYTAQPANLPWPGSYTTNMFYDPQDLFDPTKTSNQFTNRMLLAGSQLDFSNRYTFQRLLQCIGTGSSPEYGVFVYTNSTKATRDALGNGIPDGPPTWLRTKVNLNYDNTAQIRNSNAPYAPMPTNLTSWAPLNFFSNTADLLLRSQMFVPATNIVPVGLASPTNSFQTNYVHFGITNIPVYNWTNTSIRYSAQLHRMLQLAANIYEATGHAFANSSVTPTVYYPHVFRPQFEMRLAPNGTVGTITITNYALVTNDFLTQVQNKLFKFPTDHTIQPNDNIWGVPWIVGAVKGIPSFNRYSCETREVMTSKIIFVRSVANGVPNVGAPPIYTNQFYEFAVSNIIGMDAWNPYRSNFPLQVHIVASNYFTMEITNNYNYGFFTNLNLSTNLILSSWPGVRSSNAFISFFQTNFVALPPGYFSEHLRRYIPFTNANPALNTVLPIDMAQTGWPVHNWTVNTTNYVSYYMYYYTGVSNVVLDFVNLGPIGSSTNFSQWLANNNPFFLAGKATDAASSPMSDGMIAQIQYAMDNNTALYNSLRFPGRSPYKQGANFSTDPIPNNTPYFQGLEEPYTWEVNDPLVHYTVDDLTWPGGPTVQAQTYTGETVGMPLTNDVGTVSRRYDPWNAPASLVGNNMVFKDPGITSPDAWQFPTNLFPSVGWLGRVHRGTPWQTVYLKPNSPPERLQSDTSNWTNRWVSTIETWPTNDWALLGLFTTVPNDNAARGLLSINQTNDAAWAAVLAGVVALSNVSSSVVEGVPIGSENLSVEMSDLMDTPTNAAMTIGGINSVRPPSGLFHSIGDILAAPSLTVGSPYLNASEPYTDEMVERIPQQILSLLKVGNPQFVIYSWGQSLRPKSFYYVPGLNFNICTNYEITGEVLTRTVCHFVSGPDPTATNGPSPKFVIDSFNIEPGN